MRYFGSVLIAMAVALSLGSVIEAIAKSMGTQVDYTSPVMWTYFACCFLLGRFANRLFGE